MRQLRPLQEQLEDRTLLSGNFQSIGPFAAIGDSSGPSIIFKIGPGGAITTTNTGVGPYDGVEDTYVGVINLANWGSR